MRPLDGARLGTPTIPGGFDPAEVLRGFCRALHASIRDSGLFPDDEPLETVLTLPANANGAQRYVTRRSFQEAGFDVLAVEHKFDRSWHGRTSAVPGRLYSNRRGRRV